VKLLLDTHLLLWAAGAPKRLSKATRTLLADPRNALFYSAASLWEVAIKRALGRADFRVEPRVLRRSLRDNGYAELPITGEHAVASEELPPLHKDRVDRILIAQALTEGITLPRPIRRSRDTPGRSSGFEAAVGGPTPQKALAQYPPRALAQFCWR
jgi:PIN domain nuclease of toxin-antitoxin system